jgi:hypothetical protein
VREVDARLVLAGPMVSTRFEQALKDGIRELGLTEKVDLVGVVEHDQIPALLATAAVCVVPAASDLTPNPTVVYPTKLLEYMACKRPIVAPRRETVQQVVENNREALLFEPGDPIDLARKVLRILAEPALAQHLSNAAYERVRREFTASATRRALQRAYAVIAERFDQAVDDDDDAPKVEMLDDDFEATVFEEAPIAAPAVDTALNRIGDPEALADALAQLDGSTSSEHVVAPPPPSVGGPDDTLDRHPVAPALRSDDGDVSSSPPTPDDWVVTNVAGVVQSIGDDVDTGSVVHKPELEDGTPADGSPTATPALSSTEDNMFVAGEIDVPTPPPDKRVTEPQASQSTVEAHEFIAADPDTGSRTPPLERRNP